MDDEAGVARGSTSYYFRTRLALQEAVLDRVAKLDVDDAVAAVRQTPEDPLARVAQLVVGWLTEPGLTRTRARLELFLMASREPTLATRMGSLREGLITLGTESTDRAAAETIIYLIDGLVLASVRERRPAPTLTVVMGVLQSVLPVRPGSGWPGI